MKLDEFKPDLNDIPNPILCRSIGNISLFIWKKPEFHFFVCETFPYELDGQTPLIFLQLGFFEFLFHSKFLYRIIYKRKYGFPPAGLL